MGGDGLKLHLGRFRLGIRKNFFSGIVVKRHVLVGVVVRG